MKVSKSMIARVGGVLLLASAGVLFGGISKAEAAFVLRITDLGTSTVTTIHDNVAGEDLNNLVANNITFSGTVGNFDVALESALTNTPGTAQIARINLTGNGIVNNGAEADLLIEVTATGFMFPASSPLVLSNSVGTTVSGGVNGTDVHSFAEADNTNTQFGQTAATSVNACTITGAVTASCDGTVSTIFASSIPFSLTGNATIHLVSGATVLGYTETVAAVPEPEVLALFGSGLFGFAAYTRRRFFGRRAS